MSRVGRYSREEIDALAEGYEELREVDNKAWILVRLVDMWRAYRHISKPYQESILLVGMLGYSTRGAAELLGVSHTTVYKRYTRGLEAMRNYLNGEYH